MNIMKIKSAISWSKKVAYAVLLLAGLSGKVNAQYDPLFTQYMFNEMFINPAYAGSRDFLSATALYRDQWVGIDGAPKTQTFSIHSPIANKKIGLGFSIMNESIGVEHQTGIFGSYAYRIQTSDVGFLSFGLQGAVINLQENYLDVIEHDQGDIQFSENVHKIVPNMGFGIYYKTEKYYAGFSIPRLVENRLDISSTDVIVNKFNTRNWHYFLTGGYVFNLSENIKLKPQIMMKAVDGAPLQVDGTIMALFNEILWVGSTYRSEDAVAFIAQFQVNKQIRIGYSYDYTTSQLNNYGNGSHEITLGVDFPTKKLRIVTPRYF